MIVLSLFKGLIEVPDFDPDAPLHPHGSLRVTSLVRDKAIADAAALYGVFPTEIWPGRGRTRVVAYARHLTCYLLHNHRRSGGLRAYSLPEIGRAMGLDHSTVLWAIRSHIARREGLKVKRRRPEAVAA